MPLTVALPRERREGERRVALVPAAVQRLLEMPGRAVRIESGCGRAAGFHDHDYADVEIAPDFAATVAGADVVCKVGVPTRAEIERLPAGAVLLSLTRAFLHLAEIEALATRGITTIAMDRVPRTARGRAMDALSSQATVAGYKAALLAAELSPRLFPMMTTAAGTIRPSRVVVVGAGVAGLQAIATARRLGAEVEAYDVRSTARERIESLGASMIDTGVDGTDTSGHARALRRDEQQHQHDVLAERLARAHAVICAASIPDRPAPCIVTRDMVEGMLPDTVIVDIAATTGGNCELTRAGEQVQYGDTLIAGPLNLASQGAVHASEMYARNVTNMLELIFDEAGALALDDDDDILGRAVLTHDGEICDAATAASLGRTPRPFGHAGATIVGEDADSSWASEAPAPEPVPDDAQAASAAARSTARAAANPGDSGHGGGERAGTVSGGASGTSEASSGAPAAANPSGDHGASDADDGDGARTTRARFGASVAAGTSGHAPDGTAPAPRTDAASSEVAPGDGADGDEARDDLTVIDGVGPALQERLYAFGVKRLEALAGLDEPGRQRLAVQLELDDEIADEDWSGQARRILAARGRSKGSV